MPWGLKDNAIEIVDGCNALNISNGDAIEGQCNWYIDLRALLTPSDTLADMCAIDNRIVPRTFENVFVFDYLAREFVPPALEAIAETCLRLPRSAAAVASFKGNLRGNMRGRALGLSDDRALKVLERAEARRRNR